MPIWASISMFKSCVYMENNINIKKIIKAVVYSMILLVLFLIVQTALDVFSMAFSAGYAIFRAFKGDSFYLSRPITEFATGPDAVALATLLATAATAILFGMWWILHNRDWGMLSKRFKNGLNAVKSKFFVLIIVALFAYGLAEISFLIVALLSPEAVEEYEKVSESFLSNKPIIDILTLAILAPIGEECLFRGLILEKYSKCMNVWVAIILQALLFGIFHGNLVQGFYVLALGAINGYLVMKFGSVLPAILTHMILNGFSLSLSYIPETVVSTKQFQSLILMIPFMAGGLLFTLLPRDEYGQIDLRL